MSDRPVSPRSIPRRPRLVPVSSDPSSPQSDEPGQRYVLHLDAEAVREQSWRLSAWYVRRRAVLLKMS